MQYQPRVIERQDLQALFDALRGAGHRLLGPTVRANAVVLDEIEQTTDLPIGLIDTHGGGKYSLQETGRGQCFGCVVGLQSWKRHLHLPHATLWQADKNGRAFAPAVAANVPLKRAFIGVRACDLAAMAIHDKVLLDGPYRDTVYEHMRKNNFILAVNCTRAGGTCFCAAMGTGPRVTAGFDLLLTEVCDDTRHFFVAEAGSKAGAHMLERVPTRPANDDETAGAASAVESVAAQMGRQVDTEGLKEKLYCMLEHPHWAEIAKRCLTCGNCTMVCPTCFCTTIEDRTSLGGESAQRVRKWDSCFTVDFSYICGGSIRPSGSARYRQWLMHKMAAWVDQFGTYGCVGCGRCITWCPVGIDITEEVRAFGTIKEGAESHV